MKNPLFYLFCLSLLWLSVACSDDEHLPTAGDGTLTLRIPASLSTRAGEGEDASGGSSDTDATSELESGEGTVKDLWFMAYPTETGKGETLVRRLPTSSLPINGDYQEFSLTLKYGTYHVYVAANLPNISATTSEETLKNMVLSFQTGTGSSATPQLPSTAQGLPMFKDCGEITISETGSKEITADLVFLCAKVKFTLEFDNSISGGTFGSNGLQLTEINIKHIAGESKLFEPKSHNLTSFLDKTGCYTADERIQEDNEKKWNYTTTFYLPEYYLNETNKQPTYLEIKGTEIKLKADGTYDSDTPVEHTYILPLGGEAYDYTASPSEAFKGGNLVRGTYYNLVAQISSTGKQSLDVQMNIASWTTETVRPFSQQTELWLSRTGKADDLKVPDTDKDIPGESERIKVTSQANDFILYRTNAEYITTDCIDKIDDKPIILAYPEEGKEKGEGRIVFHINPEITYDDYQRKFQGTARVGITANNLTKYVDVQYDVSPYLIVTPLEVEILTEEGGEEKQATYVVSYETNLGGVRISGFDLNEETQTATRTVNAPDGQGNLVMTCENPSSARGKITLKTNGETKNSWQTSFTVYPQSEGSNYNQLAQKVNITVRPVLGPYIIHFIAINDERKISTNGSTIETQEALIRPHVENSRNLPENDGWKVHRIYIYTQYGMTADVIPPSVWYFFDPASDAGNIMKDRPYWPGVKMEKDENNPGWYVYHLESDFEGICSIDGSNVKTPKPGETLIMFNSGMKDMAENQGEGWRLYDYHRYPYDMEPGVSLFDFSNREGWFVYDPTVSSYEFYSEKPNIELVPYVMYTKDQSIAYWERSYGPSLKIFGDSSSSDDEEFYNMQCSQVTDGNNQTWHKTVLKLWAIEGKEAKNIIVKNTKDDATSQYGVLFGGRRFKDNTGYYDNGWKEGLPPGVTD